jgi:hypothetical protein
MAAATVPRLAERLRGAVAEPEADMEATRQLVHDAVAAHLSEAGAVASRR